MILEAVDIHLHLTPVLMGQLPGLEVKQSRALQDIIVENQVDKRSCPLLPANL